eukprot:365243-Chlamydomonas_euryale.AAC.13
MSTCIGGREGRIEPNRGRLLEQGGSGPALEQCGDAMTGAHRSGGGRNRSGPALEQCGDTMTGAYRSGGEEQKQACS